MINQRTLYKYELTKRPFSLLNGNCFFISDKDLAYNVHLSWASSSM